MADEKQRIYLIRHGETAWSQAGRHTSTTDLSLTPQGRQDAQRLHHYFPQLELTYLFTSPMQRAQETCELAGLDLAPDVDGDLSEWDYGGQPLRIVILMVCCASGWQDRARDLYGF